jgi:hypothetical protein
MKPLFDEIYKRHIKSVAEAGIPILHRVISGEKRWMLPAPKNYQGTIYGNGLIYEHRLIMEYYLDRLLGKDDIVHHKDGDRLNNRLENLELMSRSGHTAHHSPDPETVILICDYCGNTFPRRKNKTYKGYKHNFCSLSHSVKFQMREMYQTTIIKHGTQSGYRHGCRCERCKDYQNEKMRKYRESKRQKENIGV